MFNLDDLKMVTGKVQKVKKFRMQPPLMMIPESAWGETRYNELGRYYFTPSKQYYPSVTTFLGWFDDEEWKKEWIERVGQEEADRISAEACERGELVHKVLEGYVMNDQDFSADQAKQFRFMFQQIRRVLDRKLDSVFYVEHALYSDKLKIAGRVDLAGMWSGYSAIIDFKNKNRLSKRDDIEDYFIQATVYAIMHAERYGVLPEKLVILCAIADDEHRLECQVFEDFTKKWIPVVMEKIKKFREESGYYDNLNFEQDNNPA